MKTWKELLNQFIDWAYNRKPKLHDFRKMDNPALSAGLEKGELFLACIKSRNNNYVSKQITKYSGPYSHVIFVADFPKFSNTVTSAELFRLNLKLKKYYGVVKEKIRWMVLGSADDNGMNYFSISQYQQRDMVIFKVTGTREQLEAIVHEFLVPKFMESHYDYTGLVGQIFKKIKLVGKKIYAFFDDEHAWYCSEQVELARKHGIILSEGPDSSPTEVVTYCRSRYEVAYLKGTID